MTVTVLISRLPPQVLSLFAVTTQSMVGKKPLLLAAMALGDYAYESLIRIVAYHIQDDYFRS